MKKTLLFAFALLFATAMMAQNRMVLLQESFDGASVPNGWSIDAHANNWSVSATNNAGGQANEMKLDWSPQFNGMTRLIMPAVDLTGLSSVVFSFKHALDNYSGANGIGVATSSDGGTTWNDAWTQSYSTSGSWAVSQEVSTPDMGQANVQFCIFFNGNSYNNNDWYFDDVMIFTLENLDLSITSVTLPDFVGSGETSFGINVFNFGATTVTSVEATYEVEGMDAVTETFPVNIPSLGTATLNFNTTTVLSPGSYNVVYTLNLVNGQVDDVIDNNTMEKAVSVAIGAAERIPMIEHFSSSTCGPCVSVNTQMLNFCNNNPGRFTYTKYQMNWPGNGDPYYTEEGGTRRTYYGVNAVPQCFLDGEDQGYAAVQQGVFDEHALRTAFMDIRGSFVVEGNIITVKADVMPYIDADARVFVSVNEKETHNNTGGNGETSFHHIFMKMLPDAQGTSVNFTACELQHLEFTQDMSGTHVEEMSDLEVSIWVQNYNTKEMFNSRFAYEYTEVHPYPVENLTVINEAPLRGTMYAVWDAPANGNPIGYDVYVNNVLVAENITVPNYSFESQPDEFYVVGVVAKYENDMSSVKVLAGASSSLQDMGLVNLGSPYVELTVAEPEADVFVTNGNYGSHTPIEITAITETNPLDEHYVVIEPMNALPYTITEGEEFHFNIGPNASNGRSVAETTVKVESDGGEVIFNVTVDGELLKVTELSSTAKVYPNPANDQVRIESAHSIESVMVYNAMGVLVETIPANSMTLNVNLSQYSNGVYFFNIRQSDGMVSNQRVVVRH
ncbi:MAG: T9SS type A sorting domain-containing protein [Muribaculaceae bacterium]|nr:T9SS type A sorting domain-containing protein [Muribaculaceae bacterium]